METWINFRVKVLNVFSKKALGGIVKMVAPTLREDHLNKPELILWIASSEAAWREALTWIDDFGAAK